MIPIQLTIEGLYSYQDKQTINFQMLTNAGLFGIFGAVGSGKSSILEAITFGLYGETERLNARDKRSYNMMNLKSNRSYIEFDFLNFQNEKYRVSREFKRNSKNFEDVKPTNTVFYKWKNERWLPLDHANAEEYVGLSYANFKRTIIIPQGQFKEFLELGATERTNMMKEIFHLHQYDLQNNCSALNAINRSELDQLEGQLKAFEEIDAEKIAEKKEQLENEKIIFHEVEKNFEVIKEKHQHLKNLKTDFDLLESKKIVFNKLADQKEEFEKIALETERYDLISRSFKSLIFEKKKLTNEIEQQISAEKEQQKIVLHLEEEFKKINKELETILPKFENLSTAKKEENDLKLVLQAIHLSNEKVKLQTRTKNGLEKVKESEKKQQEIKKEISKLEKVVVAAKLEKVDSALLVAVGNWFADNKNLKNVHLDQIKTIEKLVKKLDIVNEELDIFKINTDTYLSDFNKDREALEEETKLHLNRKIQLEVQQKISHYTQDLEEGKPCPMCGALEHPKVLTFENVDMALKTLTKKIEKCEGAKVQLQNTILDINKILERKSFFKEQISNENLKLKEIISRQTQHAKSFSWAEFTSDNELDFNKKRAASFEIEREVELLAEKLKNYYEHKELERENTKHFNEILSAFKLKEMEVETQINTSISNLEILDWQNYKDQNSGEISRKYETLSYSNVEVASKFQHLSAREKIISPKLSAERANISNFKKRIMQLTDENDINEDLLKEALKKNDFIELKEVEAIINKELDIIKRRAEVQHFIVEFQTLSNAVEDLKLKLKDLTFDEQAFINSEFELEKGTKDFRNANETYLKTGHELTRLQKEFVKKEQLLVSFEKLQKRAENLKVMMNLFKGAGFVQYVSSIFLRQLCDQANIRFHRMTRNQLSLQLNENNDFEIIDYLNEGRCRSVKTLSGGQAFQVSLSLALALAETVQAKTATEKNFFFIDEGFGTQDTESVNIVFETLSDLQKENRIVGIISHVEELKEKMPVTLQIDKDTENGSIISYN